jgi:hypothetical protein
MAVRSVSAAAVLTAAAVVVCVLVRRRDRRLRREAAVHRLVAGCAHRDNAVLLEQLDVLRRRLAEVLAHHDPTDSPTKGGT